MRCPASREPKLRIVVAVGQIENEALRNAVARNEAFKSGVLDNISIAINRPAVRTRRRELDSGSIVHHIKAVRSDATPIDSDGTPAHCAGGKTERKRVFTITTVKVLHLAECDRAETRYCQGARVHSIDIPGGGRYNIDLNGVVLTGLGADHFYDVVVNPVATVSTGNLDIRNSVPVIVEDPKGNRAQIGVWVGI